MSDNQSFIIGKRFRSIRTELRMNQEIFANNIDYKQTGITKIENGVIFPTIPVMQKLHNKFNININWLLCGKGKMYIDGYNIGDDISFVEENKIDYTINYKDKYIQNLEIRIQNMEKVMELFLLEHYNKKKTQTG